MRPEQRKLTVRFWGFAVLAYLSVGFVHAEEFLLDALARSTVTASYESEETEPFNFVYARVDRDGREITYERVARVEGFVRYSTYEMSSYDSRDSAVDWYKDQIASIDGRIVFECEGRDCGRATLWTNFVFKQRALSTTDIKQHYIAAELSKDSTHELFSIYVVERGNKRVYAHVVQVSVDGEVDLGSNQDFVGGLARHGIVVLEDVVPNRYGELTSEALDLLKGLSTQLDDFKNETVFVICHVNGSRPADQLIEEATTCAEEAAERLKGDSDIDIRPFAMGPLAPLEGGVPKSRVEVVIPRLLRREP